MASGTRSGKQPASVAPDEDVAAASSNQQLAIRAFSPEQDAALDQRFNDINASIIATNAKYDNMMRMLEQILQRQTTSSPILPSIETSPLAPPAASSSSTPPAAPPQLHCYRRHHGLQPSDYCEQKMLDSLI